LITREPPVPGAGGIAGEAEGGFRPGAPARMAGDAPRKGKKKTIFTKPIHGGRIKFTATSDRAEQLN
jgi:hypothetical protein